jgi:uncharacterized membrane protein YgaE (UPF0421/DUF939 family)
MPDTSRSIPRRVNRRVLVHSARTAAAAVVSLVVARALEPPEAYWATITTLFIVQSTLGAALAVSEQRFAGTALGAVMGALLTTYFGSNLIVFGLGVFVIGLICAALRLEDAYRLATVTLAIVMLIAHTKQAWIVAAHRFIEVSVGIAVGLALTGLAGRRIKGKSRAAWFPFGIGSVNYFAGAAAAACSRSTSLRRAALPRSARK